MFSLSPEELQILTLSLRVASVSVLASLPIAILVALLLARADFPGKTLVDALVHLPLVLPPVVVGFGLLALLGRRGPIGTVLDECCGIVFAFRWTGAAVASALMGFPLMVRAIRLSIEAIDRRYEIAARTLGRSVTSGSRSYPRPALRRSTLATWMARLVMRRRCSRPCSAHRDRSHRALRRPRRRHGFRCRSPPRRAAWSSSRTYASP